MADSRLLRVCSSGVGQGFFVGVSTPIPAPWYPLSARTGIAGHADRYRAGSTWSPAAVGSWVEPGSTGPVRTGNPAKIHHHLHVAPERLPLARIPQVAARVRVAPGPPGRCGSGSRPGRRSALSTRAVAEGPREGPGPGRRSPPGPHADTGRPWPGSPSSRGPGWSGRCPPPSTSAGATPGTRQVAALGHGRASCALRWAANHRQMAWAMDSGTSPVAG